MPGDKDKKESRSGEKRGGEHERKERGGGEKRGK